MAGKKNSKSRKSNKNRNQNRSTGKTPQKSKKNLQQEIPFYQGLKLAIEHHKKNQNVRKNPYNNIEIAEIILTPNDSGVFQMMIFSNYGLFSESCGIYVPLSPVFKGNHPWMWEK